jgi:2-C-methyl-D-erythritol 2,4-cyclodiphosphate synthase
MEPPRFGLGYDVHQLAVGRRMVIGGVEIDHETGPLGHSDADVLCHAITDALLGAAGDGDIGTHFPDTDPQWAGADSIVLLEGAVARLASAGFTPWNVDATVAIERPKLAPHREAMRDRLAQALGIDRSRVSVKATRGEGMGFVGREEGVAAFAVASIVRTQD